MLKEIISLLRQALKPKPRVDPPQTLLYDHNTDQFVMFDTKSAVTDFSLRAGVWPSQVLTYSNTHMAYATWAGQGAKILKKRVS